MAAIAEPRTDARPFHLGAWMHGPRFGLIWPLVVYAITRLAGAVFIATSSKHQIPVGPGTIPGYFVYHELPAHPGYFATITNWDGQWYQAIATDGYSLPAASDPDSASKMWYWAFPPGFPLTAGSAMRILGIPFGVAATAVNAVAGASAMVLLFSILDRAGGRFLAAGGVLLSCCFVTAPLFQAAYSESMAMVFVMLAIALIQRERYFLAILPTIALSLTRLITPVLAVVVLVHAIGRIRGEDRKPRRIEIIGMGLLSAFAIGGIGLWSAIAASVIGPTGFQRFSYTRGKPMNWFTTALVDFGWSGLVILLCLVGLLALAAVGSRGRAWGLELRTWSIAYPVYILAVTPMTSGILRYLLLVPTLGLIGVGSPHPDERPAHRHLVVVLASALIGLAAQWFWVNNSLAITSPKVAVP